MNATLEFARFLSSGYFVGDLGFIMDGFAVVVCVREFCRGFCAGGVVLPGGGWFVRGSLSGGGFVRGSLSGGVLSGGFCPGGFVRGILSGGFCPGVLFGEVLSGGVLSRGVLSTGGFCLSWGFVYHGVLSVGEFCPAGY